MNYPGSNQLSLNLSTMSAIVEKWLNEVHNNEGIRVLDVGYSAGDVTFLVEFTDEPGEKS